MCDAAADCEVNDNEDSPYITALLYLQTKLAEVTDTQSQQEFLSCMGYLLASQRQEKLAHQISTDQHAEGGDQMMESQFLTAEGADGNGHLLSESSVTADKQQWARRTQVFEAIMAFLPDGAVQPRDNLVSCTNAWESLL